MKIAFALMGHKEPGQIGRLVKKMFHPDFDFYIHIDKKIDITPFKYLEKEPNVYFVKKRISTQWGSYSFATAMLSVAREILQSDKDYDFISSISGQDYPIKTNDYIASYYSDKLSNSFMAIVNDGDPWWDHAVTRVEKYHMTDFTFRGRYVIQSILNAILPKRTFPVFDKLYGSPDGSWWTMNTVMVQYLLDFLESHPELDRFWRYTWGSDEFFIHTVMMNSSYKKDIIRESGRYIDWSQGGANPKILTKEDFEDLKNSDKLFARKFDMSIDTEILDLLDNII